MKEFVCFSSTDVFVPVSQLSTRDLFYFLENLKIKQDIFVLSFSSSSIIRTTSVMILLFQIISRNSFQERIISWVFRVFLQSQLWCPSWIFDTSFSERCLSCWLVKEIITFLSLGRHIENVFLFKRLRDMASLWDVIRLFISQGGVFNFFSFGVWREKSPYKVGRHVEINLKLIHMASGGLRPIRSGAM